MSNQPDKHLRATLPIADRPHIGLTTFDAKDPVGNSPPIKPLRPPEGGVGAGSPFGGPGDMPTAERLAANGLMYNRFHTTALCAPTRAALLNGRNHHAVNMGIVGEAARSAVL